MVRIGRFGAITVVVTLLLATSAYALTAEQDCQKRKLKALGKLELCLRKNRAKVIAGKPDASATCQLKFSAALTKAGPACHYLDNADGTVTDLNTGLIWEKKDAICPGIHCYTDLLTWGVINNSPDGEAFTVFLYGLNGGTSPDGVATSGCFTGHCNWRLPTIEELSGLLDLSAAGCGSGSPCIDPIFGPTQAGIGFGGYWSATTFSTPNAAWGVFFNNNLLDLIDVDGKSGTDHVRAVRDGS